MSSAEDYLKALDGTHNPASVEDGFASLDDGKYQVRLDKLYVGESQKGKVQCVFEMEVVSGQYAGRKVNKYSGMETEDQLDFLTKDMRRLGIATFMWSDLQSKFKGVLDHLYEITLKTKVNEKGSFQSIYINKEIKNGDLNLVSSALKDKPKF